MIAFLLREGWRNFSRLGIIGLLSLASLTITLSLVGLAARGYCLVEDWKAGILGRFEIEAFLAAEVDSSMAMEMAREIEGMKDVDHVSYVSKELAARRFRAQFGDDLFDLLEYNPLPSSLVVILKGDADPLKSWRRSSEAIAAIPGVDDVVYEGDLLAKVDRFYRTTGLGVGIAVGLTLIVSLVLTMMSVRSVIRSRKEFIQIVSLSGGTNFMARGPFVVLGGYYGFVSGLIAAGIVLLIDWIVKFAWGLKPSMMLWWIPAFLVCGVCIGMIGAGWAAQRQIREYERRAV